MADAVLSRIHARQAGADERRRSACRLRAEVHEGKGTMTVDVGLAIQAAIARGEAHRATSQRQIRVRLFNYPQGLAVVVTVPARDYAEVDASMWLPGDPVARAEPERPRVVGYRRRVCHCR
jgi:hypothetical protein